MSDDLDELRQILARQSIRLGEFTVTSEQKAHYYCDTKATVLSPRGARLCGRALFTLLSDRDIEAVGGLAVGATYLATAVAMASDEAGQPIYGFAVRSQAKGHGTESKIDASWHPDGRPLITPGRRVAVVDDVVTTAGSIVEAIEAVQAAGCEVVAVAAVLNRKAGGDARIRSMGLPFAALFDADEHGTLSPGAGFAS